MAKRALVIGSQTAGLKGVDGDAKRMAEALRRRGFEVDLRVAGDATRDGILGGYERLERDARKDDVLIVYYAGHGALLDAGKSARGLPFIQAIIPTDFFPIKDKDFRGISSFELSAKLRTLTAKTRNLTVVFDCCHSAKITRTLAVPRALPNPERVGVEAYLERLAKQGIRIDESPQGDPNAVRLMAAGTLQSAYEYRNANREIAGVFTEALVMALDESVEAAVTWRMVLDRARDRVLARFPAQRPEGEGPVGRALFELAEPEADGSLSVLDGGKRLAGGALHRVHVGDEYAIVAPGPVSIDDALADATVVDVGSTTSILRVAFRAPHAIVPDGARGVPVRSAATRRAVGSSVSEATRPTLLAAIEQSKLLRVGIESEEPLLATVEENDAGLVIRHEDQVGILPASKSKDGIASVVTNLERLAVAQSLRELEGDGGDGWKVDDVHVEWGTVVDGVARPEDEGAYLNVGDHVYVKVTNRSKKTLYVSVFDVGIAQRIALMNYDDPSGVLLAPGASTLLGAGPGGQLIGFPLGWAAGVPDGDLRDEEFVAIFTDEPQDLRMLEGAGYQVPRNARSTRSELEKQIEQMSRGATRDTMLGKPKRQVGYAVKHVRFALSSKPRAGARDRLEFLLDECPHESLRLASARGWNDKRIAIRLNEIVVHATHGWFKKRVRVDTIVITQNERDIYRCETARFPGIKDGDRLPMDNLLIFHGKASQFVDMCVWVSQDEEDSPLLAELIAKELNSPEYTTAANALLGLALAGPQAAAGVAAIAGVATIAAIAQRVIKAVTERSIGLYRTSLLASDNFGIGRHPDSGLLPAQDFSFSYEVVPQ